MVGTGPASDIGPWNTTSVSNDGEEGRAEKVIRITVYRMKIIFFSSAGKINTKIYNIQGPQKAVNTCVTFCCYKFFLQNNMYIFHLSTTVKSID